MADYSKIVSLVTGGNSGIGLETAVGLASSGATVVIVSRDAKRGEQAREEITRRSGNSGIELIVADLSFGASVRQAAEQFLSRHDRLHVLVNNAGGLFQQLQMSPDRFEMTFALNYLAPFLLTHTLLGALKAGGGRIVNVASAVQAKTLDLDQLRDPGSYSSMKVYGRAKLAVIMFTYWLAKKLKGTGVTVNALHPGAIYTPQSSRTVPGFLRPAMRLFMASPEQGAQPSLRLALAPEMEGVTGKYYNKLQEARTVPISYNSELQERLYERSLDWCDLK
ncbi:SDR family oxidoreductase [Paenibacillaceae bacterium WGS1546]|uniref:SDR family oxidoreductase n=1 Tax=Cohnella sp. WGS1546 TaxID=3366810 RepID=UPI00372D42A9